MRTPIRILLVLSLVATVMLPVATAAIAGGDSHRSPADEGAAIIDWNIAATSAAVTCGMSPNENPLAESRLYAMTHLAIYQALRSLGRHSGPSAANAAVTAAAYDILLPGLGACAKPGLDVAQRLSLSAIPDGRDKWRGIHAGKTAAARVIAQRSHDGVTADFKWQVFDYEQGTAPGVWRFTPAAPGEGLRNFAFAPDWGSVTPFVLKKATQFMPGPPHSLTSAEYAADVNEIQKLGALENSSRTAEQTQIATFWVGSSPYQWNNIARNLIADSRLDALSTARLFGLMNMAMADGYIASFNTKYTYDFWRPVTAIRLADTDGNPATTADPDWYPLVPTPPIPDYESAHAVEGAAAAAVLEGILGRRGNDFSVCSLTLANEQQRCGGPAEVLRHFDSPSQAAAENGVSRIYVGFHFRDAVDKGLTRGAQIGRYTVATALR